MQWQLQRNLIFFRKFENHSKNQYLSTMLIEFNQEYLYDLYWYGKTSDKKHRFQPQVIKGYKRAVDMLRSAKRMEDLLPINGLHFEALKGDKNGTYSVRANNQYRVEFTIREVGGEQIASLCLILELSNHYD